MVCTTFAHYQVPSSRYRDSVADVVMALRYITPTGVEVGAADDFEAMAKTIRRLSLGGLSGV